MELVLGILIGAVGGPIAFGLLCAVWPEKWSQPRPS